MVSGGRLICTNRATRDGTRVGPALVVWRDLPSWYAVSGADRVIDPALQGLVS